MRSLKTKNALLATSLVLLTLGSVGWLQHRQLGQDYIALLLQQQDALAQTVVDDLADRLATHQAVLARTARDVDAATLGDPAAQQRLFARSDTRTLFDEIVLIAPDGRVVATDPPQQAPAPVSLADRDFFRQVLASGEPATSQPLLARTSGRPVVRLAVPVKDGSGRLIAVLAAGIDLLKPKVLGHIADAHIGSTGYYAIATRGDHPVYVIHPDRRRVLQPAPPVLIVDPTEAWDTDVVTRKAVRGPGWELRAVLPAEEAFAPLHHARQRLLLQMLLLALASGVLAWFGSDALLRPLGRLLAAMRTLRASPGAAVTLDLHGSDEQGALAREFDALMRELHERQAESAAAVDASPLGLFRTDREGRMTYVNEAYLRMHGLAREDAATGWLTLLREDLRAKAWANWQRTVQSAEPLQVLQRVRRADATEAVLSVRTAPIIVDGRVVGHAGTLSDITERALAERAQRTLTVIFDATTDYVVQADRRGRITYMNPASRRHNGLAPDAPVDHLSYADFNPPEMLERYRRQIVPTALAQGVWVGETIALDLSGQRTVCSHMLIAHRDKRGRLEHFSAIMRDISVEKAAAQALARNEQTLRSLADTMPAIVAVIDRQQRYRFVNASFERWYQVSRDSIAGRAVRDVIGEPEYRYSEPYIERVLAGEDAVYDKAFHERGSRRHLEVHYTPLRAADGSVDGYVVVAHDITARKEEEQRLRELTRVDPLTGLLNRNGFDEHLRECADRAQADEELLALLYIDLDHFKQVNDRHGHPVGDELLKIFAKRMRNAVRPGDAVARLGGDEFAIVLAGLKASANAERVADKVLAAARAPFNVGKLSLQVGASVGIAFWQRGDGDAQQLVERADAMLYRAKQGGRGRHAGAERPG